MEDLSRREALLRYARVCYARLANKPSVRSVAERIWRKTTYPDRTAAWQVIWQLVEAADPFLHDLPPQADLETLTVAELTERTGLFNRLQEQNFERIVDDVERTLLQIFTLLTDTKRPSTASSPFAYIPDHRETLRKIYALIQAASPSYYQVGNVMYDNLRGLDYDARGVKDDSSIPAEKVWHTYFKDTPFALLPQPERVPLPFEQQTRFSHTHVVGSTGSGKTTLLQNMILHDLKAGAAVIVMDPHRVLIPALARLKYQKRRLIIVDPKNPPGINLFDVPNTDDPDEAREILANVVKMLSYFFDDADTDTTGKQSMVFNYLCRLILSRTEKHGTQTVMDLFNFLENPKPYLPDIERMPPLAQAFFAKFLKPTPEFRNTAGELSYRLQTFLVDPTFEAMLTAKKTELDFAKEMEAGSIILIDASMKTLGTFFTTYGKMFLALIMEAARRRDPNQKHRPCFLYVDECHHFMDEQAHELLTDARKHQVGCIFAHQDMNEIASSTVRSALMGTAIKFAGGVVPSDARGLAESMRTSHEFILGQPEYHFAAYVKNKTPKAVSILPNEDPFAPFPQISEDEYAARFAKRPRPASSQSTPTDTGMDDAY